MRKLTEHFMLWLMIVIAVLILLCGPVKAAEIGIVTNEKAITCERAQKDFDATAQRWRHLHNLLIVTKDPSLRLSLETEKKALIDLGGRILMWQAENCRDSQSSSSTSSSSSMISSTSSSVSAIGLGDRQLLSFLQFTHVRPQLVQTPHLHRIMDSFKGRIHRKVFVSVEENR